MDHDEIKFTPLSDGLGFHPFANGLPYAPTRPLNGTGAVAAGRPTVARSITLPVATRPQARVEPARPAQPVAATPARRSDELLVAPQYDGFYPLKRMLAWCVDTILGAAVVLATFSWALARSEVRPETLAHPTVFWLTLAFVFFFNWALVTAQEVALSTTIGKRVFGLSLDGTPGTLLTRAVLFIPSFAFAGLGLAWALFDRDRRCWHDVASGVQPHESVIL